MRRIAALSLLALAGVSCGGSSAGTLDCAWLAGEDNCWRTTASAATSCLPPASPSGTLSADKRTCTYASGSVVTFDPPLVLPLPTRPTWKFTVATGGQPCLSYVETAQGGITLTVKGQTFTEGGSGTGLTFTCPDGKSVATANALSLLTCDGNFGGLPGNAWSSSDTGVSFGLINTSLANDQSLSVFDCDLP